jgi:CBS domain
LPRRDLQTIGIVTERDILYRVLAQDKDPSSTLSKDVTNYPLISTDENSSIKDGICLMRNRYIRRLPINKEGNVIGIATLKRIVGNIPTQGIDLAEVELPTGSPGNEIICPYCQQKFEDRDKISYHINKVPFIELLVFIVLCRYGSDTLRRIMLFSAGFLLSLVDMFQCTLTLARGI